MLDLDIATSKIEDLMQEDTESSVTYAALECRLAIERICYERLRLAHDYISHDDLKKWQPHDIVRTLIQEVDSRVAETFSISIAPMLGRTAEPTLEEYQAMDYAQLGTQIGFNPTKLGRLWNALAKLALHISVPTSKADDVSQYGDKEAIKKKVSEALEEIKRIGEGTLLSSGWGDEVSFSCFCGKKCKRRLELLTDGQVVSCIDPDCDESYSFVKSDLSFDRRTVTIACRNCDVQRRIPKQRVETLRTDRSYSFECDGCGEEINLCWRMMCGQKTKPIQQE